MYLNIIYYFISKTLISKTIIGLKQTINNISRRRNSRPLKEMSKLEDPDKNKNAFQLALEIRRKKKLEAIEEVGPSGDKFVPRYKKITESVINLHGRTQDQMIQILKDSIICNARK